MQIRHEERCVVVAAVPNYDFSFFLGFFEDFRVVYACVNDESVVNMRLIFLTLFDCAFTLIQVLIRAEALPNLLSQVAVRHGMPHDHDF